MAGPGPATRLARGGDRWYYGYFWDGHAGPQPARTRPSPPRWTTIARFWLDDWASTASGSTPPATSSRTAAALENTPETHAWLASFRDGVHAASPDALLVGEVWDPTAIASGYVPTARST